MSETGNTKREKKTVPKLLVMYVVANPTAAKLSDKGSGKLFGSDFRSKPKMGSVGMSAKAAIVINCAKKSAAFGGSSTLRRGNRITICYVSTLLQRKLRKAE